MISRDIWNADTPKTNLTDIKVPMKRLLIIHTNTTECERVDDCAFKIKEIQQTHMGALNLPDILYNFLVASDGRIYEGCGWRAAEDSKTNIIIIALIGKNLIFISYEPQICS